MAKKIGRLGLLQKSAILPNLIPSSALRSVLKLPPHHYYFRTEIIDLIEKKLESMGCIHYLTEYSYHLPLSWRKKLKVKEHAVSIDELLVILSHHLVLA